ncbi:type II inositol-1,4,5-trisphosphate 5-phosphatase [Xylariaceae sp. FL0594]|nr:type II inositol-1,4,5-trisphosphate 5-phosphatase [Xylariaceae sp. FL0594]
MSSFEHDRSTVSATGQTDPALADSAATTHYSLSRAVNARRSEYTRSHSIRIKIGTWNVASCPGTDKDLASWFVDGDGLEPKLSAGLARLSMSEDSIVASENNKDKPEEPFESQESKAEHVHDADGTHMRVVGGDKIGLYVLGLQEVVNLSHVHQSVYSDPGTVTKWQDALEAALPKGYKLVACQQLVGLLLLIYASPEVAAGVSNESTVSIGTGLLGYMGNKGAVVSRIMLGETTRLVFSNCHLASGHDQASLDRRCWDYNKVMTSTRFAPVNHSGVLEDEGDKMGDEDFCFFFGDLNFRLDGLPGQDIRHLLTLHARGEYGASKSDVHTTLGEEGVIILHNNDDGTDGHSTPVMLSREASLVQEESEESNESDEASEDLPDPDDFMPDPSDDPASLQATLDSLLPHDQLRRVMKEGKAFHEGWREGPITFLPTYKYDVGTVGLFDSSEKKRAPSWCDRILYRTRRDTERYHKKKQDELEAKKKDEEMKERGIDKAADDESVLFDYDPTPESSGESLVAATTAYEYDEYNEDEETQNDAGEVVTQEGFVDEIDLDLYTSHQRIMSSDHKPLVAVFTLKYDAVVPELKAKVHAEVARELDRVENEGRPSVTIIIERKDSAATDASGGVDFGTVGFMRKKACSLTIANTGRVQARLKFLEKPDINDTETKRPEWLQAKFEASPGYFGVVKTRDTLMKDEVHLEPGETITALIEVQVRDLKLLRALNEDHVKLEDVVILRVADGRDHFIPIRATWQPSCFGRSLEELIRIPKGGIAAMAGQHPTLGSIPYKLDVQTSSPSELFKLIEAIESLTERVLADENMIEDVRVPRDKAGWPFDMDTLQTDAEDDFTTLQANIIEALESDRPVLEALKADVPAIKRLEIVGSTLVLFLESMPDGIVTAPLWARIEQALPQIGNVKTTGDLEEAKAGILDILSTSPYYNISFVFLMSMLARVASELLPLNKDELETINSRRLSALGKRSLSFRRTQGSAVDESAIQKRLAWERRAAEVLGAAICRTATPSNARETRSTEDRRRGLVEVFMRRETS